MKPLVLSTLVRVQVILDDCGVGLPFVGVALALRRGSSGIVGLQKGLSLNDGLYFGVVAHFALTLLFALAHLVRQVLAQVPDRVLFTDVVALGLFEFSCLSSKTSYVN